MVDVINRPNQNGVCPFIVLNDGIAVSTTNQSLSLLKTYDIKGGSIGPNGTFDLSLFYTFSDITDQKEIQARLVGVGGSMMFMQIGLATSLTGRALASFMNLGSESVQGSYPSSSSQVGNSATAYVQGAIDTSQDFQIQIYMAAFISPDTATIRHAKGVIYPG
jgi:hypothetical protein